MSSNELSNFQEQVKSVLQTIRYFEELPGDQAVAFSGGSEIAKEQATELVKQPKVKERICAALQSTADDLYDVAKDITSELWLATLGGLIVAPQNPLVYAWIALLVYRAGVKAFCVEFDLS
ncbi:MAG: hypothetical protein AAGA80_07555 [Cyanobacteria bacterium P01_F01_bin.143]